MTVDFFGKYIRDSLQHLGEYDVFVDDVKISKHNIEVSVTVTDKSPADIVRFNLSHAGAGAPEENEGTMATSKTALQRVTDALDVFKACGWDMDAAYRQARIRKSEFEYAQRRYHNDQTVSGTVRVPPVVLSNLFDMRDLLGLNPRWKSAVAKREIAAASSPIRVPAELLVDLIDGFNRAADKATRKELIVKEWDRLEKEIREKICSSIAIPEGYGNKLPGGLNDWMVDPLLDKMQSQYSQQHKDTGLPPLFMQAMSAYAEVRKGVRNWEANVASVDCRRWRFQVGSFMWVPDRIQVEYRPGVLSPPDRIAVTVCLRDCDKVAPDVEALLRKSDEQCSPVFFELSRYTYSMGCWYIGAKANLEKVCELGGCLLVTLVMDTAYMAQGDARDTDAASRQFRKEIGVEQKMGTALPNFG